MDPRVLVGPELNDSRLKAYCERRLLVFLFTSTLAAQISLAYLEEGYKIRRGQDMQLFDALKSDCNEVRLLSIHPGSCNGSLSGDLTSVSLDDDPKYDALSYMWGPSEPSSILTINTIHQIRISPNLAKAIYCLRSHNTSCTIWIDAICINQEDTEERNTQVSLMRRIYTQASTVHAYVDREIYLSDDLHQKLHKLDASNDASSLGDDPWIWHPLINLLQDEYWERLWIQQELVLAQKILVHSTSCTITGAALMAFQTLLARRGHPEVQYSNTGHRRLLSNPDAWTSLSDRIALTLVPSKHLLWWRKMRELQEPILLLELVPPSEFSGNSVVAPWREWENNENLPVCLFGAMRFAARLRVTDPRDRVYGILGLVVDVKDDDIVVDYSKTEVEVQIDVVRFLLRTTSRLRFLSYGGLEVSEESDSLSRLSSSTVASDPESKPFQSSWIPKWTGESFFWVSARASAGMKVPIVSMINDDDTLLTVQGIKIDSIPPASLSLTFSKATILEFAIFLVSTISPDLQGHELGARLRTNIENLGKTLIKPGIATKQTTSSLTDQEYFLYTLLILKWGVVTADGQTRLLHSANQLIVQSSEEFDDLFKILHGQSGSDPTVLKVVNLQQILDDGIMERRWEKYNEFVQFLGFTCLGNKCISVTESGDFVILGNTSFKAGDEVWIAFGFDYPLILRPNKSKESTQEKEYVVVGPASMYGAAGVMDGAVLRVSLFGLNGMLVEGRLRELPDNIADGETLGGYSVSTIQLK